jgi:Fe-S cluster assembly protein SufD
LGRGSEHIDTTLVVDHAVPGGESRELFKGVLADRARGVFQGKVIVRPNAQKTDGKQMAQALLLSPDAEFDSKPELEIFADDVVCGHGSTSAEIDEDLLFYMLSRGIPRGEARALLIESFIGEAIDKVEDESLREALSAMAKSRLAALSAVRD